MSHQQLKLKEGKLFALITKSWTNESLAVASRTVEKLINEDTDLNRPGMLLGKIQSGKTRTFLGIIALAFDSGYDISVILTKGTKALARQTTRRVKKEFLEPIEDHEVRVFDVMSVPSSLTPSELRSKLILIVKKEDDNLSKLREFLFKKYPHLAQKQILIIDDEADIASVSFVKKNGVIKPAVIAELIDTLRSSLEKVSFLQVTATPYSLYLQPDAEVLSANGVSRPTRPAFTELVPVHDKYVGGDVYFEQASVENSVASFLFVEVSQQELTALKRQDLRRLKLNEVLRSANCVKLREALVGFIVGACIARHRDESIGIRAKNYSFVIHTEQTRVSHQWQEAVTQEILAALRIEAQGCTALFSALIESTYLDFERSVQAGGGSLIPLNDVKSIVTSNLDAVAVQVVNSEKQLDTLLDEDGQLELRNKFNIFIGGQILDRGLTIDNMIGFYYGRSPRMYQQDTVLQHSRMYGARSRDDLPFTRFYTARDIYGVMKSIHEMDAALRKQFEDGNGDAGVAFIYRKQNNIVPCSPNKIRLSSIVTVSSGKRLLPVGFETLPKSSVVGVVSVLDSRIKGLLGQSQDHVLIELAEACELLDLIDKTITTENYGKWDLDAMKSTLEHLSRNCKSPDERGMVWLRVRRNVRVSRMRKSGRPLDTPFSGNDIPELSRLTRDAPGLLLLRVEGSRDEGWIADCPFWWPVMQAPLNMTTVIFASDVISN